MTFDLERDGLWSLLVDRAASERSGATLTFEDGSLTLAELRDQAQRMAHRLHRRGLGEGDRVATLLGNSRWVPVMLFAAARLGAVVVPIHTDHRGDMLEHAVSLADPALILYRGPVVDDDVLEVARGAGAGSDVLDVERLGDQPDGEGEPTDSDGGVVPSMTARELPVAILATSGTTGRSKGVVLTQGFYLTEAATYLGLLDLRPGDVLGTTLPMSHANAHCASLVGSILGRVDLVCGARFSASTFWDFVNRHRITVVNLIGPMVPILLNAHRAPVTNTLRVVVGGGVPAEATQQFAERFGAEVHEIYGLTEVGIVTARRGEDAPIGSVGRALEHWRVRVVDPGPSEGGGNGLVNRETDGAVRQGEVGLIQILPLHRHARFLEYWNAPDQTSQSQTEDGWFRTSDLGSFDAHGNLSFKGRLADVIRRGGENISVDEIEMLVLRHPAVTDCAVVAVPSELAEDDVKLVYATRDPDELEPAELHAFCARTLSRYMVPRYIEPRRVIPRTPTEKVIRGALTEVTDATVEFTRNPR